MNYANAVEYLVIVDPPRRRYRLLQAVPTVADPTRAAMIVAVRREVRRCLLKAGESDPGNFDVAAISPDVNGWYVLP